jgi:hypothetical protein
MSNPKSSSLPFFDESRSNASQPSRLGTIRHAPKAAKRPPMLVAGSGSETQYQLVYSDSYSIKRTKYFRSGLMSYYQKFLSRQKCHVHLINRKDITFDLLLTPENHLERKITSLNYS